MRYLLRGGPVDGECKTMIAAAASIQHTEDGVTTFYFPTDETFTQDGEEVLIYEPAGQ